MDTWRQARPAMSYRALSLAKREIQGVPLKSVFKIQPDCVFESRLVCSLDLTGAFFFFFFFPFIPFRRVILYF